MSMGGRDRSLQDCSDSEVKGTEGGLPSERPDLIKVTESYGSTKFPKDMFSAECEPPVDAQLRGNTPTPGALGASLPLGPQGALTPHT